MMALRYILSPSVATVPSSPPSHPPAHSSEEKSNKYQIRTQQVVDDGTTYITSTCREEEEQPATSPQKRRREEQTPSFTFHQQPQLFDNDSTTKSLRSLHSTNGSVRTDIDGYRSLEERQKHNHVRRSSEEIYGVKKVIPLRERASSLPIVSTARRRSSSKRCSFPGGCSKGAIGSTHLCRRHGGGKRCTFEGCTKSSAGSMGLCVRHGGGRRCVVPGCTNCCQGSTDYCKAHGGGVRCRIEGCRKSSQGPSQLCMRHGGGTRCVVPKCIKRVSVRSPFCSQHTAMAVSQQATTAERGVHAPPQQALLGRH